MTPKAPATTGNGLVRRHSSRTIAATVITSATGRHVTSSRKMLSRTAAGTRTPTSAQSRHTRRGGSGTRGSAQSERMAFPSTSPP
jgi:hypothetical protein